MDNHMLSKKYILMIGGFLLSNVTFADWQQHNRAISLTSGLMQQDYREYDKKGQTTNGIFNTEKENIHEIALNSRFQSQKGMWLQGRVSSITGGTEYNGYLQNTNNLQLPPIFQ